MHAVKTRNLAFLDTRIQYLIYGTGVIGLRVFSNFASFKETTRRKGGSEGVKKGRRGREAGTCKVMVSVLCLSLSGS